MLCNQFSEYLVDASSSVLEIKPAPEHRYLPRPEIKPEDFDTADTFPNPNDNNARGAWLVGNDSEVLDVRVKEIEEEEAREAAEKAANPKKPFQKKPNDETDTENNSDDNSPADADASDDDAEKAGEDILNIDEEVGDKDSGEGDEPKSEEPAPKKKSSFSGMWKKDKPDDEEDTEASDDE